jgi:hypothetical protein
LDRTAQQSNDQTVINALSSANNGTQQSGAMYTVFVPMNNAFNQLPTDMDQLRNDVNNLVLKGSLFLLVLFLKVIVTTYIIYTLRILDSGSNQTNER